MKGLKRAVMLACLLPLAGPGFALGFEDAWTAIGPQGGDVRSLAVDRATPGRVYLGASGGSLYRSDSGGDRWLRLSPGFPRRDQNLDELAVTPGGDLVVGFWDVHGRGGGVAVSSDGGLNFTISLDGESVRSIALSPSNASIVVAGALSGVFLSEDGGYHWRRISPSGHKALLHIESVAIDARDPGIIYAGTWHLPWKTMDGGRTWFPVAFGMIEDSDVFTLTLDQRDPQRVHATACSGIYDSKDSGLTWSRIQGMPYSSRRARAFAQDPAQPRTFYAGTTEGLWVSNDDTATWRLRTRSDTVVNAIAVLPGGAVLLGTDGEGILRSPDRGRSWEPSNVGFSERFVSRIVFDPSRTRVLAATWGDPFDGGVFVSSSPRGVWTALGGGLKGRSVLSLAVASPVLLAGTDHGLFALDPSAASWRPIALEGDGAALYPRINDLVVLPGGAVIAGTSAGLYRKDAASSTYTLAFTDGGEVTSLTLVRGASPILAATGKHVYESRDDGRSWRPTGSRPGAARINALIAGDTSELLFAATSRGLYRSLDSGHSWDSDALGLPQADFTGLASSPDGARLAVGGFNPGGIYWSEDAGGTWKRLGGEGLATDRAWAVAFNPSLSDELLVGFAVGGLRVVRAAPPRPISLR